MNSGTLLGYRVIAQSEGVDLGKVRQVIFDAPRGLAAALLLGDKDLFGLMDAQVVPWNEIQTIGENAIIVASAASRQKAGDLPDILPLLEQKHLVPGATIYTEDGTGLGTMKDVLFGADGVITDYEISEGLLKDTLQGTRFMPASFSVRLGEEVIFVDSEAAKNLRSAPPDYQASLDAVKQQMSKSFNETTGKIKDAWEEGSDHPGPTEK